MTTNPAVQIQNNLSSVTVSAHCERELGAQAVWLLSSAKPGNGVAELRDDDVDTFWQSDGQQPHTITVQFHRKTPVRSLAIYVDYKRDESYTPARIALRLGDTQQTLRDIQLIELEEPVGWVVVDLAHESASEHGIIRTNVVQLAVLASHQNGRDTHIRQMKIFGPRQPDTKGFNTELSEWTTLEFNQFSNIR